MARAFCSLSLAVFRFASANAASSAELSHSNLVSALLGCFLPEAPEEVPGGVSGGVSGDGSGVDGLSTFRGVERFSCRSRASSCRRLAMRDAMLSPPLGGESGKVSLEKLGSTCTFSSCVLSFNDHGSST